MVITGQYRIIYDGRGLQSSDKGAQYSEWYAFQIIAPNGQVIGEYHIHPGRHGGFRSGNLRLFANNSFGEVLIGRATDWQWLCDHVSGQVPARNTSMGGGRSSSSHSSNNNSWGRK
jgi:hypothetical protein